MEILQEVDRQALVSRYQADEQFGYLCLGLYRRHCYRVHLSRLEFERLILNSSPQTPAPSAPVEYPTLGEAIKQIQDKPKFLETTDSGGGLSGTKIVEKSEELKRKPEVLIECFIIDADVVLQGRLGEYYVIDGMHRLVAYGLLSDLADEYFPITLHYCTDRSHK